MTTYKNTIEITDLSWNDVSGNVNTVAKNHKIHNIIKTCKFYNIAKNA
jgi:hypothetical protein